MTSIAGRSSSSPEFGGDAPTLSPPESRRVRPGSASSSSSNSVASCDAPPTPTVCPSIVVVVCSSCPWKSFSPMIGTGVYFLRAFRMSRRTTPCACAGSGTPSRNAAVGATSMLRTLRAVRWAIAGPPARNVARMFVFVDRSCVSGT